MIDELEEHRIPNLFSISLHYHQCSFGILKSTLAYSPEKKTNAISRKLIRTKKTNRWQIFLFLFAEIPYTDHLTYQRRVITDTTSDNQRKQFTALESVTNYDDDESTSIWQSQPAHFQGMIIHNGDIILCEKNTDLVASTTPSIEVVEILSPAKHINGMDY